MTIEIHELDITDGLNKMLYDKLKAENEKLKKKLEIAVEALEWYADYTNSMRGVFNMKPEKEAQEALKQIKEVSK